MSALARRLRRTPDRWRKARRWLLWRSIPRPRPAKPRKVPYYVCGTPRNGVFDTDADLGRLALDEAIAALAHGAYAGLGFALGRMAPDSIGRASTSTTLPSVPGLRLLADDLPGYTETSPSRKGHAIGYGRPFASLGSNGSGIEACSASRYFTVTADEAGLHNPVCLADYVERVLKPAAQPQRDARPRQRSSSSSPRKHWPNCAARSPPCAATTATCGSPTASGRNWATRVARCGWNGLPDQRQYDAADAAHKSGDGFTADRTGLCGHLAEAQRAGWLNPLSNAALPRAHPMFVPKSDDPYWGFRFAPDMVNHLKPTQWLNCASCCPDCTAVLYRQRQLKSFVMIDMACRSPPARHWRARKRNSAPCFPPAGEGEQFRQAPRRVVHGTNTRASGSPSARSPRSGREPARPVHRRHPP